MYSAAASRSSQAGSLHTTSRAIGTCDEPPLRAGSFAPVRRLREHAGSSGARRGGTGCPRATRRRVGCRVARVLRPWQSSRRPPRNHCNPSASSGQSVCRDVPGRVRLLIDVRRNNARIRRMLNYRRRYETSRHCRAVGSASPTGDYPAARREVVSRSCGDGGGGAQFRRALGTGVSPRQEERAPESPDTGAAAVVVAHGAGEVEGGVTPGSERGRVRDGTVDGQTGGGRHPKRVRGALHRGRGVATPTEESRVELAKAGTSRPPA